MGFKVAEAVCRIQEEEENEVSLNPAAPNSFKYISNTDVKVYNIIILHNVSLKFVSFSLSSCRLQMWIMGPQPQHTRHYCCGFHSK